MIFCLKKSPDPLVRALHDAFGMIPIIPPQSDVHIGNVLAYDSGGFRERTHIDQLLRGIDEKNWKIQDTFLSEFVGKFSGTLDASMATVLTAHLTDAWSGSAPGKKSSHDALKAVIDGKMTSSTSLSISVADGRQFRIDAATIQKSIANASIDRASPFLASGINLYVVVRTWWAKQVAIKVTGEKAAAGRLQAALVDYLKGSKGLKIDIGDHEQLKFGNAERPVCFAATAVGLKLDGYKPALNLRKWPNSAARGDPSRIKDDFHDIANALEDKAWGENEFLDLSQSRR